MGSLSDEGPLVELAALVRARLADGGSPLFVGLDGRSGTGKSTLAAALVADLAAGPDPVRVLVIEGDDFYAGGTASRWDRRTPAEKADHVIDWQRQRAVLADLRAWGTTAWFPFDWDDPYWDQDPPPCADHPTVVELAPVVVLEGAYSCRPEVRDLLDVTVLLDAPEDLRRARLLAREGDDHDAAWDARWSEAEDHYFGRIVPAEGFDLVLTAS